VKVFDFLEVVITSAAMAAAVNSFERALAVPGALEEFGGDALPRFMAGQFSRKAFTSSVECHLHICNRSFVEGAPTSRAYPTPIVILRDRAHANIACVGSAKVSHDLRPDQLPPRTMARSASRSSFEARYARTCNANGEAGRRSCRPVLNFELPRTAAGLGTSAATRISTRTRCCLAAARIGLSGRMRGSTRPFLLSHKSRFSRVAGLDALIRFLLHLFVGLHLLLARLRRPLRECRHGDRGSKSDRHGEN
jgi:hypothetical protein